MLWLALALACYPDDYDPNYEPPVFDTGEGQAALVGDWVSEGADLSDLFANDPFNYERVDASFGIDGTYAVRVTTTSNEVADLTGTYTVDTSTTPSGLTLVQLQPYEATAIGIWQVEDGVLTYEVVQTVPDYGFTPPNATSGFGTTTGPGMSPGANIQVYR